MPQGTAWEDGSVGVEGARRPSPRYCRTPTIAPVDLPTQPAPSLPPSLASRPGSAPLRPRHDGGHDAVATSPAP